jgi:MFS family permease
MQPEPSPARAGGRCVTLGSAFNRLWAAQAVSAFGARITREGLPIMAILALGAQAGDLGVLAASASAAALATALGAGALVDRARRRRTLIGADLLRALALATIPLAALTDALTLAHVLIVAALVAAASVVFEMASHAYLPAILGKERLVAANSRLAATDSVAEVGGPALAGLLFQWLTAPIAVAFNALTYLASAVFLARSPDDAEPPPRSAQPWRQAAAEGLRTVWREPKLRALLLMESAQGLCGGVFSALYALFVLQILHLSPAQLGLAIAAGGAGAFAGAVLAPQLARRLGQGRAILIAMAGAGLAVAITPLAPTGAAGLAALVASQVLGDALAVAGAILAASLRQTLAPQDVAARVSGAFQAGAGGMAILGALGGGALAAAADPRTALLVASLGFVLLPLIGALSPLRDPGETVSPD